MTSTSVMYKGNCDLSNALPVCAEVCDMLSSWRLELCPISLKDMYTLEPAEQEMLHI